MPADNLDIKSVKNFLTGLKSKLDELGRHL
jgi:hypothetical protein